MAKIKTTYLCESCDYRSPKWMGQCPRCGTWESMVVHREDKTKPAPAPVGAVNLASYGSIEPERLARFASGFGELDRVLGGGFVPGSLLLLGGDPGIGKSTLMLQVAGVPTGSEQIGAVCFR